MPRVTNRADLLVLIALALIVILAALLAFSGRLIPPRASTWVVVPEPGEE